MKPDSSREKRSEKSASIADRPDRWLLREWKLGNEQAAEVFFNRYAIRLVALVASRLNNRYRPAIDPDEVVQSAMGSFFNAARHSRIEVSRSISLWKLLATFARRKMARRIERESAAKRGGEHERVSLDGVEPCVTFEAESSDENQASELLRLVRSEFPEEVLDVVEGLLAGQTQRELAESLKINERTVRRRLVRVREHLAGAEGIDVSLFEDARSSKRPTAPPVNLPMVSYSEFLLGKMIGTGGFGKVYRAKLRAGDRTVAVKFLRKSFWQNENARRSFANEIDLAFRIDHPCVIRYLSYGESPHGGPYLLSEWIDGETLYEAASPPAEQLTNWTNQICQAIEAVHQAGLVHGDLTPNNILVDNHDRITITDFGFSQATASGTTAISGGTPGFAAPEQVDPCFGTIGPRTDIYAIGGLIHWLLFRSPPNTGHGLGETIAQTMNANESRASRFTDCKQPFRAILEATLCPSPADRLESVSEIVTLLGANAVGP